jgi:mannose-6-phosphate isomerase
MAIALTPFKAFCGFLPPTKIAKFLEVVPELGSIIPPSTSECLNAAISSGLLSSHSPADPIKDAIRQVFGTLMKAPAPIVQDTIASIIRRYESGGATSGEYAVKDLLVTLNNQFPGDVGILCIFILNVVSLEPGQAIFLQANEPHAYLNGGVCLYFPSDHLFHAVTE